MTYTHTNFVPTQQTIRLTQYSHGAGCGCKISPQKLNAILQSQLPHITYPQLLVGNDSKDDAAVYDIGNEMAIVSTTDFFMPIVDDPFDFGRIAATNAISDIYAMGASPLMAIAIFAWPMEKLSTDIAARVIDGGRAMCQQAGIPLAGGHSIDAPEPIFGLAVTGQIHKTQIKYNNRAQAGSRLYLTKPLGIGILTTAQKKQHLKPAHQQLVIDTMCTLNRAGSLFAQLDGVTAMTDVTGFGLLGHLLEMCQGSSLSATLEFDAIPKLPDLTHYLKLGCSPGGAQRNYESYQDQLGPMTDKQKHILCDPQTSGGLLVAVKPDAEHEFLTLAQQQGMHLQVIGQLQPQDTSKPTIEVL